MKQLECMGIYHARGKFVISWSKKKVRLNEEKLQYVLAKVHNELQQREFGDQRIQDF